MPELAVARVAHGLGDVLRIGGVAMVTTVPLRATRRLTTAQEHIAFLEAVERGSVAGAGCGACHRIVSSRLCNTTAPTEPSRSPAPKAR